MICAAVLLELWVQSFRQYSRTTASWLNLLYIFIRPSGDGTSAALHQQGYQPGLSRQIWSHRPAVSIAALHFRCRVYAIGSDRHAGSPGRHAVEDNRWFSWVLSAQSLTTAISRYLHGNTAAGRWPDNRVLNAPRDSGKLTIRRWLSRRAGQRAKRTSVLVVICVPSAVDEAGRKRIQCADWS